MYEHRWIKDNKNYTLEDSNGNVLLEVEDRTCNGNSVTEQFLQNVAK